MTSTLKKALRGEFHSMEPEQATLFHYCDAHAFESIIRNNEIWLSPFVYSNDTREGQACRDALRALAAEFNVSNEALTGFFSYMEASGGALGCFGMSFSEDGDMLSQWRGYAADGAGFAIGFDVAQLRSLPPAATESLNNPRATSDLLLNKVEYDALKSIERLRPFFHDHAAAIERRWSNSTEAPDELPDDNDRAMAHWALTGALLFNWDKLFSIKGAAFREEREWRISTTVIGASNAFQYRVSRGMLIPYIRYQLPDTKSGKNPITATIMGPRNLTHERVVDQMLEQYHHKFRAARSAATYR